MARCPSRTIPQSDSDTCGARAEGRGDRTRSVQVTVKAASSLPEAMAFRGDAPVVARSRGVEAGSRADSKPLRVAIVHYWLVSMRGGEKVVEELCRMFPQADIFTLVYNPDRTSDFLNSRNIRTSFLQKIPRST